MCTTWFKSPIRIPKLPNGIAVGAAVDSIYAVMQLIIGTNGLMLVTFHIQRGVAVRNVPTITMDSQLSQFQSKERTCGGKMVTTTVVENWSLEL